MTARAPGHRCTRAGAGKRVLLFHREIGGIDIEGVEQVRFPGEEAAAGIVLMPILCGSTAMDVTPGRAKSNGTGFFKERDHHPAKCCIDMEEEVVLAGDLCKVGNRVNHAVFGGAGNTDECDGVLVDLFRGHVCIHPEVLVEGYPAHLKAEDIAGLLEREVGGFRAR